MAYPVVSLGRTTLTLRDYVRSLESVVIQALKPLGVSAQSIPGKTGVWVNGKKVASIGVAVERWITFHGLALNVNTDMSYFDAINPCGFNSSVMTSVEAILGKSVPMGDVKGYIKNAYSNVMGTALREGDIHELLEFAGR